MTLYFDGVISKEHATTLNEAHNRTLMTALEDSNDNEIEALRDFADALMVYAGIRDDGETTPGHCDECGEVKLELSDRDLCATCEAESGEVRCPNCGEYVAAGDMGHWPNLKEPISMCPSCEHNARRSGWEPGQ